MPTQTGSIDLKSIKQLNDITASKSDAVASTVSIYYRSSTNYSSPYTAITPTTSTSIGTNSDTDGAWEYVMPKPKNGRYFYTCERYTMVNGDVSFSTVRALDSETYVSKWVSSADSTYIDGGALYANSVTAAKIAAETITANELHSGAVTADKIATGAITIGKVNSSDTDTVEGLLNSSISVGGRNLFRYTAMDNRSTFVAKTDTDSAKYFRYFNGAASNHTFSEWENGVYQDTILLNSATNIGVAFVRSATEIDLDSSSYYTISCWAKCTKSGATLDIGLSYRKTNDTFVWRDGTNSQIFTATNTWQKFTLKFKPDADTKAVFYCFTVKGTSNGTNTFTIRNCKLEKGNIATEWSDSPEDIAEAKKMATNYLTDITNGGVFVHAEDTPDDYTDSGANGVLITDAIDVIRNGRSVAYYSEHSRIGSTDGTRIEMMPGRLSMLTDNTAFFSIDSVAGIDAVLRYVCDRTVIDTLYSGLFPISPSLYDDIDHSNYITVLLRGKTTQSGITEDFLLSGSFNQGTSETKTLSAATQSGTISCSVGYSPYVFSFDNFSGNIDSNTLYLSIYYSIDAPAPCAKIGKIEYSGEFGAYSVSEGKHTKALGIGAHTEGIETVASGAGSHAEGNGTAHSLIASGTGAHAEGFAAYADIIASGLGSHAEGRGSTASGDSSHAEGMYTTASGYESHAEGNGSVASGGSSHAQNRGTIASQECQTAIGRYNIEDTNSKYALIIGNGEKNGTTITRSDAFTVNWNGNIEMALDTSAASSTKDGKLYAAITALSWQSEVIV